MQAWKELKQHGYPGGVKLTTKELRDYFATQVSPQVPNPNTVKNLMRHTSLNLGDNSWRQFGGNSLRNTTQNTILGELLVRLAKRRNISETNGGRSRTRTYDLAHVRRAL